MPAPTIYGRPLWCGRLARRMHSCIDEPRAARPSSPAFWAAPGVPASRNQRGHSVVNGRSVTTLIARAAASF